MRAALFQIGTECFESRDAQRNDAFFIAFTANQDAAGVKREVAGRKTRNFRDAQASCIKQLKNGAITQGCGAGLRLARSDPSRDFRAIEHGVYFRLG